MRGRAWTFSVALCRGLIEARSLVVVDWRYRCRFPWLYAAASLKRDGLLVLTVSPWRVFRGFMPRPH